MVNLSIYHNVAVILSVNQVEYFCFKMMLSCEWKYGNVDLEHGKCFDFGMIAA